MKMIAKLAIALAIGVAGIAPATAATVCLKTYLIDSTHVTDAKTILFRMRDGAVWSNTLRTPCSGLRFHGFQYTLHEDQLCGYGQVIRVLTTEEVCVLGNFTKVEPVHT